MKYKQSCLVIGIMCFLLSFGIVIQISSIKNDSTIVAIENTENELRNEVLKLTDEYNKLFFKLEKSEQKLDNLRYTVSNEDEVSKNSTDELVKSNNYLGLSDVSGEGIEIEVKDCDLLLIINALNNAGAEAISINDKRVVFGTTIKNDGDVILLDGEILATPYKIKAIGSQTIYGAVTMPGSYIDKLRKSGIEAKVVKISKIDIPKYSGVYKFNFAEIVNSEKK